MTKAPEGLELFLKVLGKTRTLIVNRKMVFGTQEEVFGSPNWEAVRDDTLDLLLKELASKQEDRNTPAYVLVGKLNAGGNLPIVINGFTILRVAYGRDIIDYLLEVLQPDGETKHFTLTTFKRKVVK